MQDLKQKLADQGLVGTLIIRETGQKIPLRFARGETKKLCKLELGPTSVDVELRLVEIPGATAEQPNLTLTLVSVGSAVIDTANSHEEQTAKVNDAAKLEAETKAKADAEAAEKAAADEAERAEAARLTKIAEEKAAEEKSTKPSIPVETPTSSSQSVAPSRKTGR